MSEAGTGVSVPVRDTSRVRPLRWEYLSPWRRAGRPEAVGAMEQGGDKTSNILPITHINN